MHICIVSPSYPTSKTIDFIFVDQLCRALADKGEVISVIAPQSVTKSLIRNIPLSPRYSLLRTTTGNIVHLYRPLYLTVGAMGGLLKNFNSKSFHRALRYVFTRLKQKPDVCYGHFWQSVYALFPLAEKFGIPLIASSGEERVAIHEQISSEELSKMVNYISGAISVSSKNKIECVAAGLVKEQDCIVISNAIDNNLFYLKDKFKLREQYNFSPEIFIVAFVGQFHNRKGTARLSEALTFLNDNSIKAIFLGTGLEHPDYKGTLIAKTIPHDLLPDYLNCADIFVLPTLNEGCCNAIIEAMACGLPIVSSDLPFNYDILNKRNSILINPENIIEISNAIKYLKSNPKKRKELSSNALKTASDLTLPARAEKIIQFINSIV